MVCFHYRGRQVSNDGTLPKSAACPIGVTPGSEASGERSRSPRTVGAPGQDAGQAAAAAQLRATISPCSRRQREPARGSQDNQPGRSASARPQCASLSRRLPASYRGPAAPQGGDVRPRGTQPRDRSDRYSRPGRPAAAAVAAAAGSRRMARLRPATRAQRDVARDGGDARRGARRRRRLDLIEPRPWGTV